jgi:phage shock protein PspC (stress-responsive transcriptional regulator)
MDSVKRVTKKAPSKLQPSNTTQMKKIININFHSRVVPIEETAYEILQQYIESLRKYFANEEGREEIISDIENRFAELFSENLKKGATCITDEDVNTIIASMGRPEDFEQEEMSGGTGNTGESARQQAGADQQQNAYQSGAEEPHRLYRSVNDKILGGVCGGLANYLRLDPAIVRIIFVLIFFAWGTGFLLYIILWMILPNKSLPINVRKRLYRNSDDRIIGGVASGLAAYFHIEKWIPRLIFAMPLILGIVTSIFRSAWYEFDAGPIFFTGGFGGSLLIIYIILWIVLPEATTASEKLEMRGEKVDLESIKNTIKSDMETFKGRAKEVGSEMQERFQQVGQQMRQRTQAFSTEAGPVVRRTSTGIGHAIGVLFRAFFLFIAGLIAFALIMAFIGLAFRGDGILTFKGYILAGFWQNFLAWTGFILFLVIPVVALLTWLIRRLTGFRSRSHYLGYTFATLWILGLFSIIILGGLIFKDFRSRQHVEEDVRLTQPAHGKLVIKAMGTRNYNFDNDWWFDTDSHNDGFFSSLNDDSLLLNTVRVSLLKSVDSNYHVQIIKFSHGYNARSARELAGQVEFPVQQADSILYLPDGFAITRGQQFRNQQVLVAVAIPVGKRILVNRNVDRYRWFTINVNKHHIHWNDGDNDDLTGDWDGDTDWNNSFSWTNNTEYIMTNDGLERTDKKRSSVNGNNDNEGNDDEDRNRNEQQGTDKPGTDDGGYRYHHSTEPASPKHSGDSSKIKRTAMITPTGSETRLYLLSTLFIQ